VAWFNPIPEPATARQKNLYIHIDAYRKETRDGLALPGQRHQGKGRESTPSMAALSDSKSANVRVDSARVGCSRTIVCLQL
jgi:hypothetical protein